MIWKELVSRALALFLQQLSALSCSFVKCDRSPPESKCFVLGISFEKNIFTVLKIFKPQLSLEKTRSSLVCFGCLPRNISNKLHKLEDAIVDPMLQIAIDI